MKLELKHLTPYLHYGLKYNLYNLQNKIDRSNVSQEDLKLHINPSKMRVTGMFPKGFSIISGDKYVYTLEYIKPILRPLSDLTKIIQYKNSKYCVMDLYYDIDQSERDLFELEGIVPEYWKSTIEMFKRWPQKIDWGFINILLEHHFDVFDLIPNDLAIDINTLEE